MRHRTTALDERSAGRSRRLPLALALLLVGASLACAAAAPAQAPSRGERVTVRSGTALRATPGGEVIGVSSRDLTGPVELVQGSFVRLTVDGHVPLSALRFTADRSRGEVEAASGVTLRASASASGGAVAELRRGTYVFPMRAGASFPVGRPTAFVQARRALWVDVSRLTGRAVAAAPATPAPGAAASAATTPVAAPSAAASAATTPVAAPSAAASAATTPVAAPSAAASSVAPAGPLLETRAPATLRTGPGGEVLASVPGGVAVASLARQDGWVRVRLEGWMPDTAVDAVGTRAAGALSAADLRADPTGTVGRVVRWTVEALSMQTADALRRGLTVGERYLLARGPGAERAVLYLALPDSLVPAAQALPPLATLSITARVRTGRSQPSGVPILDVLELTRQ
jgi:hypothetical protein